MEAIHEDELNPFKGKNTHNRRFYSGILPSMRCIIEQLQFIADRTKKDILTPFKTPH